MKLPPTTDINTINRAYRVRLRLTPEQVRMLNRLMGAKRYVWNWALERKETAWRENKTNLTGVDLSSEFTKLRHSPETVWLSDLPREPFNQLFRDFDIAWTNFFAGRAKRPRRKKYGCVDSVRFMLDQRKTQVDREKGTVKIYGIGRVKFRVTEEMQGRLRSVTVRTNAARQWYATFTADGVPAKESLTPAREIIGVDLGLRNTAALSNGQKMDAPKHLDKKLKSLKRYQRRMSRQMDAAARSIGLDPTKPLPKGTKLPVSSRRLKNKQRIGKLHVRIADARKDHQHQVTSTVIKSAKIIAIEDLAVKSMGRSMGRGFRRSVSDAGLGEIRRQLTYKAAWNKSPLVVINRWFPSSKLCSACDEVNQELKLKDSYWQCTACQTHHDRDHNAAVNIEREGLRLLEENSTPRSGGIDAQGEDTCAMIKAPIIGQPSSKNCERTYRVAKPRSRRKTGTKPVKRREG